MKLAGRRQDRTIYVVDAVESIAAFGVTTEVFPAVGAIRKILGDAIADG
jgi:hypothetical protein